MNNIFGYIIRQVRQDQEWTLEVLSHGICSPSYLSKIESGKTEASVDTVLLLMKRLQIPWNQEEMQPDELKLMKRAFLDLLLQDERLTKRTRKELPALIEKWKFSQDYIHMRLLEELYAEKPKPLPEELEISMNHEQLAWQRYLQMRYDEAIALHPWPLFYEKKGIELYKKGEALLAIEPLNIACQLAGELGHMGVMLNSTLHLSFCYGYNCQFDMMVKYMQRGANIISCMGLASMPAQVYYNLASTELELGDLESAWQFFGTRHSDQALFYHKRAICAERMGNLPEAKASLKKAYELAGKEDQDLDEDLIVRMLDLVRMRLDWPDGQYLQKEEYGKMLLESVRVFEECLQASYARFHAYWLAEWYQANRKYRDLAALYARFSSLAQIYPL